ncbi:hypothetical protein VNI00_002115 [Paramarasmius palmivorus]|uniref:F-box domain-containing protein n=1 Tax=Paramarasmius palmivorus TaxID=297713 RepID=A0AAW0E0A6_9AGAR
MSTKEATPGTAFLCQKCRTSFSDDTTVLPPSIDLEFFRSNHLPSDTEASQTRAYLDISTSKLAHLEENIRQVRDTLKALKQQKETLCGEIERQRCWISPIRRLPVEVLGEIFSRACLGDRPDEFSLVIKSVEREDTRLQCPFDCRDPDCIEEPIIVKHTIATTCRLSHVCYRWWKVIKASPPLWSSLSLDVFKLDKKHSKLVKLYLAHSAQHSLQLGLDFRNGIISIPDADLDGEDDVIRRLGQTGFDVFCDLIDEFYRCTELHDHIGLGYIVDCIDVEVHNCFPLLSFFSAVGLLPHAIFGGSEWFWNSIREAPNLTRLSVSDSIWGAMQESLPRVLHTLEILKPIDFWRVLGALSHIPELRSLCLRDFVPNYIPSSPSETLTLRFLDTVSIRTSQTLAALHHLFTPLILPVLTTLKLSVAKDDESSDGSASLEALHGLLERSSCVLQDLELHMPNSAISSNDIMSLLEARPSIIRLSLESKVTHSTTSFLPEVCARMTPNTSAQSPLMLPALRHLLIRQYFNRYSANEGVEYAEDFLGTVESRKDMYPIAEASLSISCTAMRREDILPVPPGLTQRVQGLRKAGIRCFVGLPIAEEATSEVDDLDDDSDDSDSESGSTTSESSGEEDGSLE